MRPLFTVDWEPLFCHIPYSPTWEISDTGVEETTDYLLDVLQRHQICAIWYALGWLKRKFPLLCQRILVRGHIVGDHTFYHTYNKWTLEQLANPLFRPPRWHGLKHKPKSGGFWFRAMPYWWITREILKEGMFYIHPHDLLWPEQEPTGRLYRRIGLETARDKLERLCREVEFVNASA